MRKVRRRLVCGRTEVQDWLISGGAPVENLALGEAGGARNRQVDDYKAAGLGGALTRWHAAC